MRMMMEVSMAREEDGARKGNEGGPQRGKLRFTWATGSWRARVASPAGSQRCWVAVETPLSCRCRLEEGLESVLIICERSRFTPAGGLADLPTGTTSYWPLLEPLNVLEGRGMTGGLGWRESSTTCDRRRHYSSGRILVLRPIDLSVINTDPYMWMPVLHVLNYEIQNSRVCGPQSCTIVRSCVITSLQRICLVNLNYHHVVAHHHVRVKLQATSVIVQTRVTHVERKLCQM